MLIAERALEDLRDWQAAADAVYEAAN
jgi:hypothetical protein